MDGAWAESSASNMSHPVCIASWIVRVGLPGWARKPAIARIARFGNSYLGIPVCHKRLQIDFKEFSEPGRGRYCKDGALFHLFSTGARLHKTFLCHRSPPAPTAHSTVPVLQGQSTGATRLEFVKPALFALSLSRLPAGGEQRPRGTGLSSSPEPHQCWCFFQTLAPLPSGSWGPHCESQDY